MKFSIISKVAGIFLISLIVFSCSDSGKKWPDAGFYYGNPLNIIQSDSLILPVYTFDGLEPLLQISNDTTYVINFWATWCAPCMKELPGFSRLVEEYKGQKIRVVLVCLDLKSRVDSELLPFLKKNKILPMVVLLDDPDFNSWIDRVSPDWSGSIPATLIFKGNKRGFYEKSFEYAELNQLISTYINP